LKWWRQLEMQSRFVDDLLNFTQRKHNGKLALIHHEQSLREDSQPNDSRDGIGNKAIHQRASRSRELRESRLRDSGRTGSGGDTSLNCDELDDD